MGYDVERFLLPVNEGLLCCICRDVLEDPLQGPCEHAYCSACIRAWLVHENTCPEDRRLLYSSELRPLFRYMKNDLEKLEIRCRNVQAGCTVICVLENVEKHEEDCPFHTVKCPTIGCNYMVERRKLDEHLAICDFQTRCCPKGCGLPILNDEDLGHSCVAELRMTVELLRSELICKVDESCKEMDVKMEAQKRFMIHRENSLLSKVEELQGQVNSLGEQLEAVKAELREKEAKVEQLQDEKSQMAESWKKVESMMDDMKNRSCKQCQRKDRIVALT